MPHAEYPTIPDLGDFLTGAGFTEELIETLDLETALGSGISLFEEATGRTFLATLGQRFFDLPATREPVDLRADLVSASAVTLSGSTLADGIGYRLLPINAAARG